MRCPNCSGDKDKVLETRADADETLIRRRRECNSCEFRFTTYERIDASTPVVVKSDGRREPFDRAKLARGIEAATENLDVNAEAVERIVGEIVDDLSARGSEMRSAEIGAKVETHLQLLSAVAFVRYASVHRRFTTTQEFIELISDLRPSMAVLKRDGRRQPFEVARIRRGIQWAVKHTKLDNPIEIQAITDAVTSEIAGSGRDVPSAVIGQVVQRHLRSRDAVSYLRFSSVFERFDVVDRFLHEIKSSLENG